jgi:hypothetical protein
MADERPFGMQGLASAKYLFGTDESAEPGVDVPARGARPPRSGVENTMRWFTAFVILMLVGAAGGLCWQNRASIAARVGDLKNRRSAVDVLLWASGSKKTFNEALSDRLNRAQRDTALQFDQAKPAFKTEFDHVDFQNLSQSWNGGKR